MICILQTDSQTCWKACATRFCTKDCCGVSVRLCSPASAYDKCQQTGSTDQVSVCEVQMAVATAEHQVGAFKGPVVVLADMDKAEMDAAVAKGLQGCKMEVQTSWLTHSLAHSLARSLTRSLARLPTPSLAHSLTCSLSHSHSLIRSLAHSLTPQIMCPPPGSYQVCKGLSSSLYEVHG